VLKLQLVLLLASANQITEKKVQYLHINNILSSNSTFDTSNLQGQAVD